MGLAVVVDYTMNEGIDIDCYLEPVRDNRSNTKVGRVRGVQSIQDTRPAFHRSWSVFLNPARRTFGVRGCNSALMLLDLAPLSLREIALK